MQHIETKGLILWADRQIGAPAYRFDGDEPFISLAAVDAWLRDRERRMAGASTLLQRLRGRVIAAKSED